MSENTLAGKKSGKLFAEWPLPEGGILSVLKAQAPIFSDFVSLNSWPDIDAYNFFAKPYLEAGILFTKQEEMGKRRKKKLAKDLRQRGLSLAEHYVSLIVEKNEVSSRVNNWHDFFNFISWTQFPRTKYQIFSAFYRFGKEKDQTTGRSANQDRLVVFEEGGLILVVSKKEEDIAKSLLEKNTLDCKIALLSKLRKKQVLIFGHGLYESLFASSIPVNAFTILHTVDEGFFALPLLKRLQKIDNDLSLTIPKSLLQKLGTFPSELLMDAAFG